MNYGGVPRILYLSAQRPSEPHPPTHSKYLKEKKGRRPLKFDSTHHALWPRHLEKFGDNWALIINEAGD